MKLIRRGNSLGTTFGREVLQSAGITGDDELEISATPGEIRLRRLDRHLVELTEREAIALASGKFESKAAESALAKVKKLVEGKI